jgi:hypothetical protein
MATGDLITTKWWRDVTGISESEASNTLAGILVSAASKIVRRTTQKDFLAAEYREHASGHGRANLWLRQRPIIDVISVRGTSRISSLQVKCTGSVNLATVEVEEGVSLKLRTTTSGVLTETILLFATYPTLTTLHAAVEAVSGWEAQIVTSESRVQESRELLPMNAGDALDTWLALNSTDWPIDDYDWEADEGRLIRSCGWDRGVRNWVVRYIAGYGTYTQTEDLKIAALPEDLKLLVSEIATLLYERRLEPEGMKRESLDGYTYERFGSNGSSETDYLPGTIRSRLDYWSNGGMR